MFFQTLFYGLLCFTRTTRSSLCLFLPVAPRKHVPLSRQGSPAPGDRHGAMPWASSSGSILTAVPRGKQYSSWVREEETEAEADNPGLTILSLLGSSVHPNPDCCTHASIPLNERHTYDRV